MGFSVHSEWRLFSFSFVCGVGIPLLLQVEIKSIRVSTNKLITNDDKQTTQLEKDAEMWMSILINFYWILFELRLNWTICDVCDPFA